MHHSFIFHGKAPYLHQYGYISQYYLLTFITKLNPYLPVKIAYIASLVEKEKKDKFPFF